MPNLEIGSSGEVKWLHLISKQIIQLTGIVGSISGGTVISGTANTVARYGPTGTTLIDSLIKDDGTNITFSSLAGVGDRVMLVNSAGVLAAPTGYLQSQVEAVVDTRITQTISSGDVDHAPSSDAVYDALLLKQDALGYTAENLANKGIASGYASLDGSGKVPISQIPNSIISYKGNYNALTNTPTLVNGVGNSGDTYRTNVAGPGVNSLNFVVGDFVIYNGSIWEKSAGADSVLSVFGRTGTVIALSGDYDTSLIADTLNKRYQTDNQKLYNDATSSIQTQLNSKQPQLNGVGIVVASGTSISYDPTIYYPNSNPNGYTSNTGTVSTVSVVTANGISGSVATATTTPAITLALGAITPSSVNSSGNVKGSTITVGSTTMTEDILKEHNASMSTGLYEFGSGGIAITSGTTFNVGNVKGWIVDPSDILGATPIFVNYAGGTALTTPYIATAPATYFLVNSSSVLVMQNTRPTVTERRTNIYLGVIGHPSGTLTGVGNSPDIIMNGISQVRDMFEPTKLINEGVIPSPNGANLSFNLSAGILYGFGIGFIANGPGAPSILNIAASMPTTFQYRTQTGAATANTTLILPATYDLVGVATALPGGGNTSTNQRIYLLQNGSIRIQYGQQIYTSLANAISGAGNETPVTFSNNRILGILIGILSIRKNATNLSNSADAAFLPVSKFGETVGAAAGISVGTLQTGYNNSIDPEILTNSVLGAVSIRRGSAADTDNVLEIQNNAGTQTMGLTGAGNLTTVKYFVSALNTAPSSSVDTGTTGEIRYTSGFIYVCINTNTWVRTTLSTF